ncbi:hypothetical protein [Planctopirus hydrillae]|nr:hypothetical protein [Planctopirus hydrillae]
MRSDGGHWIHDYCPLDTEGAMEAIEIVNPDYAAKLLRIPGQKWVLNSLALRHQKAYDTLIDARWESFHFPTHVGLGLKERFEEGGLRIDDYYEGTADGVQPEMFEVTIPPRSGTRQETSRYIPHIVWVRVFSGRGLGNAIQRLDQTFLLGDSPGAKTRNSTVRYTDWVTHGGFHLPRRQEGWYSDTFEPQGKPHWSADFDYSEWDSPFPKEQAYLTYYGLPEPEGVSKGWGWWWLLLAGGLLVVAMTILIRRRSS